MCKEPYTSKEKDKQVSDQLTMVEACRAFLFAGTNKPRKHGLVGNTERAIELNVSLELPLLVRHFGIQEGLEILESDFNPTKTYDERYIVHIDLNGYDHMLTR